MRRALAPALAALCLAVVPATALGEPGDLAVSDAGNHMGGTGFVFTLPQGGDTPRHLAAGSPLRDPWGVAVAGDGSLLVPDAGSEAVVRILPSGEKVTVASGSAFEDPVGITLAPGNQAYVSDRGREAVLRVDLATGVATAVAHVDEPGGLAMDKAGKLLVTNRQALLRIDPGTGATTTLASGSDLGDTRDVAVEQDGTIFVAGDDRVVRVDPSSGARKLLASGGPLHLLSSIDVDAAGDLIVADRGLDPAIVHIDRATGAMRLVASGRPFFQPTGVAYVGGAGVDLSGGGNGDADGPAAPPKETGGGGGSTGGTGGTGGSTSGAGGGSGGAGGTVVRLPDGRTITLPPGITPATSGIPGVDFVAPAFVGKARLGATRFRAARRGKAFVSISIGTRIFWTLTEAARVYISIQRYRPLARACRSSLATTSRHRTGCRRYVSVRGRYATASVAGLNSVRFRGRLRGKRLKPGRYRFVIRARDAAGNLSRAQRPGFRIVR